MKNVTFSPQKISSVRASKNISIADLARKINRNRQQVEQWEKGLRTPNAKMLCLLANGLKVTPDSFFEIDR